MLLSRSLFFGFFCLISLAQADETKPLLAYGFSDFPPYAYLDERGRPVGKGLDFLNQLIDEAGYTPQVRGFPSARWLRNIKEGSVQMWASAERAPFSLAAGLPSQYAFFTFRFCLLVPAGAPPPQLPQELQGKRLILVRGAAYPSPAVQRLLNDDSLQMEKVYAPNVSSGLGMLQRGRGDYLLAYDFALDTLSPELRASAPVCTVLATTVMRYFVSRSRPDAEQVLQAIDATFLRMSNEGRLPDWITPPPVSTPGE